MMIVGHGCCELENTDARILATTLLCGQATARESLGLLLRDIARGRFSGPLLIDREEHENALRLAIGEMERDGLGGPTLRELRQRLSVELVAS